MRKLQQFYVMKFLSGRLANTNYVIERNSILTAREKQEIVSLADSQALRSIRKIRYNRQRDIGKEGNLFSQERLEGLIQSKKKLLKREPNTRKERQEI